MTTTSLFAALLACGTAACSDGNAHDVPRGPDAQTGAPLTEARSFVIGGTLTLTSEQPAPNVPAGPQHQDFSLRIDPSGKFMVVGDGGFAVRASAKTTDSITFETTDFLRMSLTVPTTCSATVSYDRFTVTVGTNGVSGTAEGSLWVLMGDVGYTYKAKLAFTGAPDQVGPALMGVVTDVDPLAGVYVYASEPLVANAVGHLTAGAETIDLESFVPTDSGVVSGFSTRGIALRYSTTYQLNVAPWTDLAANAGGALPKVVTMAAPPQVAEDGFENGTTIVGGAAIVDATLLPPIAGQKSIAVMSGFLSPVPTLANSHRFTARLAVGATDTKVRVAFRRFGSIQQVFRDGAVVRIAVPGGAMVGAQMPENRTLTTEYKVPGAAGNAQLWLGDVQTIELSIPAGAGPEIVFDALMTGAGGCGLPTPGAGFLIDDLRVE
jgi:hypothetical protein